MLRWFLGALAVGALALYLFDPGLLLSIGVPLLAYETGAVLSAILDYRESRLACVGWSQWWRVGHATVFTRTARRVRHYWRGAVSAYHRRQLRLATEPAEDDYVILDRTAPFTGRVIDGEPQDRTSGAA